MGTQFKIKDQTLKRNSYGFRFLLLASNAFFFLCALGGSIASAQITHDDLKKIALAFHAEYDIELRAQNAAFNINEPPPGFPETFWWDQPGLRTAYASYIEKESGRREHYIKMFHEHGEMPGMTIDGAVLTICHELGHGLGGPPYKDKFPGEPDISIEAIADDYAVRTCFPRMAKHVSEILSDRRPPSYFVSRICSLRSKTKESESYCLRVFAALEVERLFYRVNPAIREDTAFDQKDPTVIPNPNTPSTITRADYYPRSQCRIDIMVAALFGDAKPKCF